MILTGLVAVYLSQFVYVDGNQIWFMGDNMSSSRDRQNRVKKWCNIMKTNATLLISPGAQMNLDISKNE